MTTLVNPPASKFIKMLSLIGVVNWNVHSLCRRIQLQRLKLSLPLYTEIIFTYTALRSRNAAGKTVTKNFLEGQESTVNWGRLEPSWGIVSDSVCTSINITSRKPQMIRLLSIWNHIFVDIYYVFASKNSSHRNEVVLEKVIIVCFSFFLYLIWFFLKKNSSSFWYDFI